MLTILLVISIFRDLFVMILRKKTFRGPPERSIIETNSAREIRFLISKGSHA